MHFLLLQQQRPTASQEWLKKENQRAKPLTELIIYGHTVEEEIEKEKAHLHESVEMEYSQNAAGRFVVSPQLVTLFTKRPKQEHKKMDRVSIKCWMRSVQEANSIRNQIHQVF